jgi:hypothetical protein
VPNSRNRMFPMRWGWVGLGAGLGQLAWEALGHVLRPEHGVVVTSAALVFMRLTPFFFHSAALRAQCLAFVKCVHTVLAWARPRVVACGERLPCLRLVACMKVGAGGWRVASSFHRHALRTTPEVAPATASLARKVLMECPDRADPRAAAVDTAVQLLKVSASYSSATAGYA